MNLFFVHIFLEMQIKGQSLDFDKFWHTLDIKACIVHKGVKELDIAEY